MASPWRRIVPGAIAAATLPRWQATRAASSRYGNPMFAEIDAAAAAFAEEHKLPGLVAGIVEEGRLSM